MTIQSSTYLPQFSTSRNLEKKIQENMDFIDKEFANAENPGKWQEAVQLTEDYLRRPENQGKKPDAKNLHVSSGDGEQVSFLTAHQEAAQQVSPSPHQVNFVQWTDGDETHVQKRTGEDTFPIFEAKMGDEDSAVTIGSASGKDFLDKIVTVYNKENAQWDGDPQSMRIPDLSSRGVKEHEAGGFQFSTDQWKVNMAEEGPVVELREKFRDTSGRLVTPTEPTALLVWSNDGLAWSEK